MKKDPRVDAYIATAAAFAQPLLVEMRQRAQQACPDATETIKWNVPFYVLNGKLVASMAAFKAHTKFGVWQDMKPHMVDASTPAELPALADWTKRLKAAAEHAKTNTKPTASKPARKTTSAKKVVAKTTTKQRAKK